jgi:phosphoglycerate dehydrogenase-like enzyme
MNKILITPRSITADGHPALDRLTQTGYEIIFSTPGHQPAEAELLATLPDCVGYLAGVEPVTAMVLAAAKSLRVISRNGTGVDNIDLESAAQHGISVCRAEGVNAQGVAELAIGLLLALARSIPSSVLAMKNCRWERRKGVELSGKTLGVIGCGKIGRLVAEKALGLGMNVVAYDLYADAAFCPSERFRFVSLEELFAECDAITLHCPPPIDRKPLIDAAAIEKMRSGVLLVNTARYDLLDPTAVLAALNHGKLAGVALDVFDREPPGDNPLAMHDRVISTPHIGGFTEESVDRAVAVAVDNLLRHLSNGE